MEGGELEVGAPLLVEARGRSRDPVVIVGGGQAGAMAARALRRLGYTGAVRILAAERHLPYERLPLSKRLSTPSDAVRQQPDSLPLTH